MRILAIYPLLDKRFTTNAYVLEKLVNLGNRLTVITTRSGGLKTSEKSTEYDDLDGYPVFRLFENTKEMRSGFQRQRSTIFDVVHHLKPDIVFCAHQHNLLLARKIARCIDVPIVLLVEYARNPYELLGRRRYYLGWAPLAWPIAGLYWNWICIHCNAIITSCPADRFYLGQIRRRQTSVHYVPWCNEIPKEVESETGEGKVETRGIYVGSLSEKKNIQEFIVTIPKFLETGLLKEFVIIGSGPGQKIVQSLKLHYGNRIKHIPSLIRSEALKLVRDSYFAYTPVKEGGWGFIGDSWGVKTPLVVTHNTYEFCANEDVLLVDDPNAIGKAIVRLHSDRGLYERLQTAGYLRYKKNHIAQVVAEKYIKIFEQVLRNSSRRHSKSAAMFIQA